MLCLFIFDIIKVEILLEYTFRAILHHQETAENISHLKQSNISHMTYSND